MYTKVNKAMAKKLESNEITNFGFGEDIQIFSMAS
jgi:hypothetical protein